MIDKMLGFKTRKFHIKIYIKLLEDKQKSRRKVLHLNMIFSTNYYPVRITGLAI